MPLSSLELCQMSNIEMVRIDNKESDYHGSPSPISDAKDHLDRSPCKNDSDEDIGSIPASSAPLLSHETCPTHSGSLLVSIWQWTVVVFASVLSVAYLAFCYVVHYRVVPAGVPGPSTDATTKFLTNLGSAVTTINIIIISLALFPLKRLLYELQSEEFFRLLSAPKNSRGVELTAVNGISNSSFGFIESIMIIINRYCSLPYAMIFIAALLVWAVSTLAPAALSIQPILIDGAIMAFSVGAIPPLSLYQPVPAGQVLLHSQFSPAREYAAAVVWAEREIGVSYSFSVSNDSQGVYSGFAVPITDMLNSTVSARWLTDVIGFNPSCTWANPVNLTATSLNVTMNSTNVPDPAVSVHLEGLNLKVLVPSSYFPIYSTSAVTFINVHDPTLTVFNYTTGSIPTDGSMVMSIVQCTASNCTEQAINILSLFVDFTDVPSMRFSSIGADYDISFLVCKPNITIETREVRTQGSMTLEVQPLAAGVSSYPKQGNLDWTQTSLLVSYSLSALTSDSGPSSSAWNGLGSGTQVNFLFGSEQMDSLPTGLVSENMTWVLKPLSTNQLTQGYTQMVKASMKPYVSGALGTTYVPGRVASVQQIFVSSLPHVITSTLLVFLLFVMAVAAHFRHGKGEEFNLTNVAAVLADSELPQMVKKTKIDVMTAGNQSGRGRWLRNGVNVGQEVARRVGNWKVSLQHPAKADGLKTLHVSRD